jgi:hypothetical protein
MDRPAAPNVNARPAPLEAGPDAPRRERLSRLADRFGATASFLCALHCAVLPFVVAVLPALGLSVLADHRYEALFVLFACCLASTTILLGRRRHGDSRAALLLLPAVGLLLAGVAVEFGAQPALHAVLVCLGGSLLALAHVVNLRLDHVHGAECSH